MAEYDNLPANASLHPSRFKVHIPQPQLDDFKKLLELSKVGPKTYENLREDRKFGISHRWLTEAKEYWETKFDWRAVEARINEFMNYEVAIRDDSGDSYAIHFIGLFSKRKDAIPLVMVHGWPGSFMEFLKLLDLLKSKYTPENLPYHVVVPSMPGYAFSTGPSLDRQWTVEDISRIINKLMVGLGFGDGYVAQGGDIGSRVSRILAAQYDACKAFHHRAERLTATVNFCWIPEPEGISASSISEIEKKGMERYNYNLQYGFAYQKMHGTRSATIGLTLSSSPLALLAWIGEKYLTWTDKDPSLDEILESVTLYWLTSTQPRSIFTYVQECGDTTTNEGEIHANRKYYGKKPMGYSYFPKDIVPVPVSWVKTTGNLVWHRVHEEGGHFAAMEKPEVLLEDVEDFIRQLQ